ncbi:MAG: glycosyltransferase family 39 protein [Acidobacteriota bacterium]
MQTVERLEVSCAELQHPTEEIRTGLFQKLESKKILLAIFITLLAFGLRVYKLDAAGLSEDETNKVFAMRAYERGDFTVNTEHPMLMKLLCLASTRTASLWNQTAGKQLGLTISEESALRFPNVLFGALTVIPILLLATALLGFETGIIASLFWAFGVNAIWFNRITKEDTLFVFFMLLGFYFYHQAKERLSSDIAGQEKFYALAGAAFGMMVGSKYFPHYIGLNALFYTLVGYNRCNNRPLTGRMWGKYFASLVLTFAAFNWAIFSPQTWRYIRAYTSEDLLTHHGYALMDKLFSNDMADMPLGNPWYFYLLYLAVKVPLPILVAFVIGLIEIFRHRGDARVARGYLFLRMMLIFWFIPMSVIGSKFLRYSLTLMPIIYMVAAVGVMTIWRLLHRYFKPLQPPATYFAAGALALIFILTPAFLTINYALPYPGLYTNRLGKNHIGYFFPHDEFYDLGARESIRYLAEHAPPNATIASEIPGVVAYYLERFNRRDLRSKIMSQPQFDLTTGKIDYVILQKGRIYFENQTNFHFVETHFPLAQASRYQGVAATEVYQISPSD